MWKPFPASMCSIGTRSTKVPCLPLAVVTQVTISARCPWRTTTRRFRITEVSVPESVANFRPVRREYETSGRSRSVHPTRRDLHSLLRRVRQARSYGKGRRSGLRVGSAVEGGEDRGCPERHERRHGRVHAASTPGALPSFLDQGLHESLELVALDGIAQAARRARRSGNGHVCLLRTITLVSTSIMLVSRSTRLTPPISTSRSLAEIRRAIEDGEAEAGRAPSTAKDLAAILGVNTNTVRVPCAFYARGLLEFRRGRGISPQVRPNGGCRAASAGARRVLAGARATAWTSWSDHRGRRAEEGRSPGTRRRNTGPRRGHQTHRDAPR